MLKSKGLSILLTAFTAAIIVFVIVIKGDVNKTEAEEGFSFQDMKGIVDEDQTMIVPSLEQMNQTGINHAIIKNGQRLIIREGGTLIVPSGVTLLVHGTLENHGTVIVEDNAAILGTPKTKYGVQDYVDQNIKFDSSLICSGGKVIIHEKGTVYLANRVSVSDGGFIANDGYLMAGKAIDVDNASIQCGSNSQIYLGYYFLEMMKKKVNSAELLDVRVLNDHLNSEIGRNRRTVLYDAKSKLDPNCQYYLWSKLKHGYYDNLGEAVYFITREAKLSNLFNDDDPFYSSKTNTNDRNGTAFTAYSRSANAFDYSKPEFNTKNGGSVNMDKGAIIYVSVRARYDGNYKNGWDNIKDLYNKKPGLGDNEVNIVLNDYGVMKIPSTKTVGVRDGYEPGYVYNGTSMLYY